LVIDAKASHGFALNPPHPPLCPFGTSPLGKGRTKVEFPPLTKGRWPKAGGVADVVNEKYDNDI